MLRLHAFQLIEVFSEFWVFKRIKYDVVSCQFVFEIRKFELLIQFEYSYLNGIDVTADVIVQNSYAAAALSE